MEIYIKKRVSAADFLRIFREYSDFSCLFPYVASLYLWKLWQNQSNNSTHCLISLLDIGIIWEDVVLMDEVLPEAALSDLSAEVSLKSFSVALLFAMMSIYVY